MMSAATATVAAVGRGKFPFTATQWQELEHQALIYKYMAAGIPIPPDLLFTIKRSLDSSLSSKLFPYQTSPLGWNPYQMGYGKKIDPEPGRCRRTDGKKWRCSKEAYPDSKYCERHMHRGKNRSRKPVESSPLTVTTTASATNAASSINSPNSVTSSTHSLNAAVTATNLTNNHSLLNNHNNKNTSNLLYSMPTSDSSYNTHLLYSQTSPYSNKDYRERYLQGMKEEVGEHAFFTESSGSSSMRGFSGSSMDENWQIAGNNNNNNNGGYPNYLSNNTRQQQQQEKQCYIWGRDFNCELSMKVEEERAVAAAAANAANLNEKTTHHFFDEWPIKAGGSRGLRDDHNSSSTTQLSISIPSSASHHHDFFSRDP